MQCDAYIAAYKIEDIGMRAWRLIPLVRVWVGGIWGWCCRMLKRDDGSDESRAALSHEIRKTEKGERYSHGGLYSLRFFTTTMYIL